MFRIVTLALLTVAASLARAQDGASDKQAAPSISPDLAAALDAARQAAQAAQAAAEAARAASESMRDALKAREGAAPVAPVAPGAPVPAAPPAGPPAWAYQLGVNLLSVSGNANAITAKLSARADGQWSKWAAMIKGGAAYGQSKALAGVEPTVTSLNADLALRGDRGFTNMIGGYVLTGGLTDHVASIQRQLYGEAGVALTWWETKEADFVKSKLKTDIGFRFTRELRHKYYPAPEELPGVDIYALRVAGLLRYALSKTSIFTEELEILPDVVDTENVRFVSTSTLSAAIAEGVSLGLGFKVRYIGKPAAGAENTDTELAAGVTWAF